MNMASETDWRSCLTASQRYDNIQRIQAALNGSGSNQSAFAVENDAYKSSLNREQYDAACSLSSTSLVSGPIPPTSSTSADDGPDSDTEAGQRIGPYQNCAYLTSGVTSSVYRSHTVALKVIVETRNLEPHNPHREAKILQLLKKPCIPLLSTFRDQEQRLVLVFPYMPLSLASMLEQGPLSDLQTRRIFTDLFNALSHIHSQGIIHRDIKPSAILLESADGPAYLSDFGTAWHPVLSAATEPADQKILDIGSGPYRAPEVLFGDRSYGPAVDMWGAGCTLAECCSPGEAGVGPAKPLFESRAVHEDGNQLGLILSIFKTMGSPTPETWPEAVVFRTPPFEVYTVFEGRTWEEILPGVEAGWKELVARLVRYESGERATAEEALRFPCMQAEDG